MKYSVDESFFEKIDTEQKAYFLGFMYADGYNCVKGNFFSLYLQNKDSEILEKFKKCLNSDYPIKTFLSKTSFNKGEPRLYCRFQISRAKMCKDLEKLGCFQCKTDLIRFPFWLKENLLNHFVRGYFDGDGGLSKESSKKTRYIRYRLNIVSNPIFIEQLNNLFYTVFSRRFYVNKCSKHTKTTQLCVNGNKAIETFCLWLYKDATIYLERKYKMYQDLLKRPYLDKKEVYVYTKNGNFVAKFPSRKSASKALKIDQASIVKCAQNNNKSAGGYKFYNKLQ